MKRLGNWLSSPKVMRRIHFWGIWFWLGVLIISIPTGWINQTAFVSALSIVALSLAHWAALQGVHAEESEDDDDQ